MKYCNNCGAAMDDSVSFCPKCGTAQLNGMDNNPNFGFGGENTFNCNPQDNGYGAAGGQDYMMEQAYSALHLITAKMRTSATIWLVIGICQVISGACTLCVGYGVAPLVLGIWNIVQSNKRKKLAAQFDSNPMGVYAYFDSQGTYNVIFLVLNLLLGALFGIIGSIYDMTVRSYAMERSRELSYLEGVAASRYGQNYGQGFNQGF